MTTAQTAQQTYERALARARSEGVKLLGRGLDKLSGIRFMIVSGSHDKQYFIGLFPDQLTCSCPAGQRGHYCKHRAFAHALLVSEREHAH